jgi:predicted nucleotidyltransferase component of viral defense system
MMKQEELEKYDTYHDKYQVEKDYLQDLILYSIYSDTIEDFVFKGGTAMSKFYYSDRFSVDLDFTSKKVDIAGVKSLIDNALKSIGYPSKYTKEPAINRFGTIEAIIEIEGPRYSRKHSTIQEIVFEINTSAVLVEKPVPMSRAPVYADARNYVAIVMDKREIFAEKIRAIMSKRRRHKERDLYDMYFLVGKGTPINKETVFKKLNESKIDFSKKELIGYIKDVQSTWERLTPFVQHTLEDYAHVSKTVINALEKDNIL